MSSDAFIQALHAWQGFYTLLGGTSATLIGLMFIAASLGARLINEEAAAQVRTFLTPTVIYFSLVLLLSALMNIPTQTPAALAAQFFAISLIGVGYSLSHVRRLYHFHRSGNLNGRDWVWNLLLPLFGSLWLAGGAFGLSRVFSGALNAAAVGALLLIMVGIRNAWDVTLYLARRAPS